jgi:hypothetical protein
MKKQLFLISTLCGILTTVLAQTCPTHIVDIEDDGFEYEATLSALSDCDAGKPFSYTTEVSLGGQPYLVVSCYDNGVQAFARIQSNGGSYIRLAETSGITITSGSTSCAYNNMGQPVSLPVELVSFSGKYIPPSGGLRGATEGGNLLTWVTANEVNNKGFSVERKMANGEWATLGFVKSNGQAATYQFLDKNPLTTSYYRLLQIDNDGKKTVSKTISIQANWTKDKLVAYPNPVSNLLTVENTEGGNFQIFNLLGQQVLAGKTGQPINVSALPQGTYFLKMGAEQVKFVKQ